MDCYSGLSAPGKPRPIVHEARGSLGTGLARPAELASVLTSSHRVPDRRSQSPDRGYFVMITNALASVSKQVKVVMIKDPDGNSIAFAEAMDSDLAH